MSTPWGLQIDMSTRGDKRKGGELTVKETKTFLVGSCTGSLDTGLSCMIGTKPRTITISSKLETSTFFTAVGGLGGILDLTPVCLVMLHRLHS